MLYLINEGHLRKPTEFRDLMLNILIFLHLPATSSKSKLKIYYSNADHPVNYYKCIMAKIC